VVDVVRSPSDPDTIELKSNQVAFTRPTPVGRHVEVVINRTYEKDQTLRSQLDSLTDVEGQLCKKIVERPDDMGDDVEPPTQFS
jgi:hypothetical protein